jgi:preprotein translocase subunit YajC
MIFTIVLLAMVFLFGIFFHIRAQREASEEPDYDPDYWQIW